ncbi:MAG: hypothetical protein ISS78_10575 [Phycisphaerae bacterium]|nr:hypothetical protein [Phycisphaerae bacterium]
MALDKIKQGAAEAMAAVEHAAGDATKSVVNAVKADADGAGGGPAEKVSKAIHQIEDYGHHKIKEAADEFHQCLPLLEQAGYSLCEFDIDVGMPPKLVAHFTVKTLLAPAQQQAVLEEARGHRMIHALLVALFKTSGLQHAVKVASLECRQVEVHLGMIPKVRLRFLDE